MSSESEPSPRSAMFPIQGVKSFCEFSPVRGSPLAKFINKNLNLTGDRGQGGERRRVEVEGYECSKEAKEEVVGAIIRGERLFE